MITWLRKLLGPTSETIYYGGDAQLEVGQIWQEQRSSSPFQPGRMSRVRIYAVKDGWVMYRYRPRGVNCTLEAQHFKKIFNLVEFH